jgi:hypothetical protein
METMEKISELRCRLDYRQMIRKRTLCIIGLVVLTWIAIAAIRYL